MRESTSPYRNSKTNNLSTKSVFHELESLLHQRRYLGFFGSGLKIKKMENKQAALKLILKK